jgi:hypothetical protein
VLTLAAPLLALVHMAKCVPQERAPLAFLILLLSWGSVCANDSDQSHVSSVVWDPVHHDVKWQLFQDEEKVCKVQMLTSKGPEFVELIGGSRRDRLYNCAQVYNFCITNRVGTIRCAETAAKLLGSIEPHGCKKGKEQVGSNGKILDHLVAPFLTVDRKLLRSVPITFVVLGDSTEHSRRKHGDIMKGWGKYEDVVFIHDENKGSRMFPIFNDLMDHTSPSFRPCTSIFFFVKSDTYVNTSTLKNWVGTHDVTWHHRPLYAGIPNSDRSGRSCQATTDEDIDYGLNNCNKDAAPDHQLPYATWDSGILINRRAMDLLTTNIMLKGSQETTVQRMKEKNHNEFHCFSHGSNNLKRLASCLFNRHGVRLTSFPFEGALRHPQVHCAATGGEKRRQPRVLTTAITVRSSSAAKPCYTPPCKSAECIYSIRRTIESIVFMVPTCARYVHRFIAWLKHINLTLGNLAQNFQVEQRQIYTVLSSSDDVPFVKLKLKEAGYGGVNIFIARGISNDIDGAQLKPMHAFHAMFKMMPKDALLQRMKYCIHVDDDTTINLAALAHRLVHYESRRDDAVIYTNLFDSHVSQGVPLSLFGLSYQAFLKVARFLDEHKLEWDTMEKTSKMAAHLYDVWYGTLAAKLDISIVHLDGIVKHHYKTDNMLTLTYEIHNYESFSNQSLAKLVDIYDRKGRMYIRQNQRFIFSNDLVQPIPERLAGERAKYYVKTPTSTVRNIGQTWKSFLKGGKKREVEQRALLKLYSSILQPAMATTVTGCRNSPSSKLKRLHSVVVFASNPLRTGGINPTNFAHATNDHLLPLYALKLLVAESPHAPVVFLAPGRHGHTLVNCDGVTDNFRTLAKVSLGCDAVRATVPMDGDMVATQGLCSDNVFEVDIHHWEKWWRLWSVHVNAAYNWNSARAVTHPYDNGRSTYAITMVYRMLASAVIVSSPAAEGRGVLTFSNRLGKRRVLNMAEIVEVSAAELGDIVDVKRDILFFDAAPLLETGAILGRTKIWASPHGANMANMLFMNAGSTVIEFLPYRCQRLRVFFRSMASTLSLKYQSLEPVEAYDVDGLKSEWSKDPLAVDEIAMARRSCDLEQCVRGEDWEYMNFTIDPRIVVETIMVAMME